MKNWYQLSGENGDTVISSRIRLARNLLDYPFPTHMNREEKNIVVNLIKDAVLDGPSAIAEQFIYKDMAEVKEIEGLAMVESHFISPDFAQKIDGRGLLLLKDKSVSIMINEEDHIRIQVLKPGLDLIEAYTFADKIDTLFDESLKLAFDDRLGYLTECPTNLGTGMRASLMLHLPMLTEAGVMPKLSNTVSKLGLIIRGIYGEGSEVKGCIYQLSNQVTLGISEKAALDNLEGIGWQIISQERSIREEKTNDIKLQDRIMRSLGLLKSSVIISYEEFMTYISNIRLGVSMGFIKDLTLDKINELIISQGAGNIMLSEDKSLIAEKRDIIRAKNIRTELKEVSL